MKYLLHTSHEDLILTRYIIKNSVGNCVRSNMEILSTACLDCSLTKFTNMSTVFRYVRVGYIGIKNARTRDKGLTLKWSSI